MVKNPKNYKLEVVDFTNGG